MPEHTLIRRIARIGEMPHAEARVAYRAFLAAMREAILEGSSVNLPTVGTVTWRKRTGRTNTKPAALNHVSAAFLRPQPDSYHIKLKTSAQLVKAIQKAGIIPESFTEPKSHKPKNT